MKPERPWIVDAIGLLLAVCAAFWFFRGWETALGIAFFGWLIIDTIRRSKGE